MQLQDFDFTMVDSKAEIVFGISESNIKGIEAYGTCGGGMNCGGGGGQCGSGMNCTGGGGQCGSGMNCAGGGGRCGSGMNCGGY